MREVNYCDGRLNVCIETKKENKKDPLREPDEFKLDVSYPAWILPASIAAAASAVVLYKFLKK